MNDIQNDPFIGKKLAGRYEIVSVIGRGNLGVVYKASQLDADKFVAIKTLKIFDPRIIQKLGADSQILAKLQHPNIAPILDFGITEKGAPFMVMDLLTGTSFRQILRANAPIMNLGRLNSVFQQVCATLTAAHAVGVVHKNLKPENIMICQQNGQSDWVYVLDFGIGEMPEYPQPGARAGCPPYVSPEQCLTPPVIDSRSDVYLLGICLFEALSGAFPFIASTDLEMLECHKQHKPRMLTELEPKFSHYESLSRLVSRAMEKQPAQRQQSAIEFAAELDAAIKADAQRGTQMKDKTFQSIIIAPKQYKARTEEEKNAEPGYLSVFTRVQSFMQGGNDPAREKARDKEKDLELQKELELVREKERQKAEREKELEREREREIERRLAVEAASKTYFTYTTCPNCDAPRKPGIGMCLSCGHALNPGRISSGKIPAEEESSLEPDESWSAPESIYKSSIKTRTALSNAGNAKMRMLCLLLIVIVFAIATFIFAGGGKWLSEGFASNTTTTTTTNPREIKKGKPR